MTKSVFITIFLLLLAGCSAPGGLNLSNFATNQNPASPSNDSGQDSRDSSNSSVHTEENRDPPPNPTTIYATPPTTTSTPVQVGPGKDTFFFSKTIVGDPIDYPEEDLLLKGYLTSRFKDFDFEKVEVSIKSSEGSFTTKANKYGCFSTFFKAKPEEFVEIFGVYSIGPSRITSLEYEDGKGIKIPSGMESSNITPCSLIDGGPAPGPLPFNPSTLVF